MGYANRRQVHLENDLLRLTLLPGGGHIAAVVLKENGASPLWDPPWETIDPSSYDPRAHPQYGADVDAQLLAGIAGHNLCFDLFGVPSAAEAAAGLGVHGEASARDWEIESADGLLTARVDLPLAGMRFERRLQLAPGSRHVAITETATNLTGVDRPVGWTQHVTLGPPFLEKGKTRFAASATKSRVFEQEFAPGHDRFTAGADFDWPFAPLSGGGEGDMRLAAASAVSGAYTAHLMNPALEDAFFTAYHPGSETLFGYFWKRKDFPWLGIWEENYSRRQAPWNGRALTRGMEFGVSPMPETRRQAVERGRLFGERTFRWIPARESATVKYLLFIARVEAEAATGRGSLTMLDRIERWAAEADFPQEIAA